jgi:cobalt/nickel transport protein
MKRLKNSFSLVFFSISLVVAGALSFYASSHPDGLEKVAEDIGFLNTAKQSTTSGSPLADYGVAGIENARLSVGLSGVIGVLVTALASYLLFAVSKKLRRRKPN